jgi:hypothetical protein
VKREDCASRGFGEPEALLSLPVHLIERIVDSRARVCENVEDEFPTVADVH